MSTSCGGPSSSNTPAPPPLTDDQFLDDIERAIFLYFWEQASATTGQVKDRAFAAGNDTRTISSIAATGFGLTALCVADQRGYMASSDILTRARATLSFLLNQMPNQNGFFYHFVDMSRGQRAFVDRHRNPAAACLPAVNIFRTRRSWTWQPRSTRASTGRGC